MSEFIRVCKTTDVPDPGKSVVIVNNHLVILIHLNGEYYAWDYSLISVDFWEGDQIVCQCHGARFDVRTGQALTMPAIHTLHTHEVKVEGNDVFVKLIPGEQRG